MESQGLMGQLAHLEHQALLVWMGLTVKMEREERRVLREEREREARMVKMERGVRGEHLVQRELKVR